MTKALSVKNLSVNYGNLTAIKDINFEVDSGDYLGIIGPNGGGKSTLIKSILNLVNHSCDKITFFDKTYNQSKKIISYVPQISKIDRTYPISVKEVVLGSNLKKSLNPFYKYTDEDNQRSLNALKNVGIEKLQNRQINKLSGGEFQRLLIARAIVSNPKILFLDEPTANVDPTSRNIIYNLLDELNQEGTTILMVSHDTMAISSKVKNIACMNVNLIYHGSPSLDKDTIEKMYGCPIDLLAHGTPHRVFGYQSH